MRIPAHFLILFYFVGFVIQGCNECSSVQPPPVAPIRFVIVDKKGNSLVTGPNAKYSADSIRLINSETGFDDNIYKKEYTESLKNILFEADSHNSSGGSAILYLYFNQYDSDTFVVSYQEHKTKCFTYSTYTKFNLNGKDIYREGELGFLSIVK